jgi:ACS family pantothenate transporter-like MFS transporter
MVSKGHLTLREKQVLKQDIMILVFGCFSFFTKNIGQQRLMPLYRMAAESQSSKQSESPINHHRGMKEDLNLLGNELNYITAVFWARIAPL